MQQERKYLQELFQKYQQGLVTEEEKKIIVTWLVQLNVSAGEVTTAQLQAKQEKSQLELRNGFFPQAPVIAKTISFPFWIFSAAASLLLVGALTVLFFWKGKDQQAEHPIAFTEIHTTTGERKVIMLSDGSRITLNNESKLKFPAVFKGKTREVFLTGQAFFDVVHQTDKPFKVHTDKLDVQVLGTSFDVKAYPEDKELSVAVATGKVGVMPLGLKKSAAYFVLPGNQLDYNKATNTFSALKTDLENINSWQNGRFIFRNETLGNITKQLERYYRTTFLFKSKSLQAKQISVKIKNQSLNSVLKALSISGEFDYKIEGNKVTLW